MASKPAIPAASKTKMAVASRAKVPEFGIAPIRVVNAKGLWRSYCPIELLAF